MGGAALHRTSAFNQFTQIPFARLCVGRRQVRAAQRRGIDRAAQHLHYLLTFVGCVWVCDSLRVYLYQNILALFAIDPYDAKDLTKLYGP